MDIDTGRYVLCHHKTIKEEVMDQKDLYLHAFQAYSQLSDAQDFSLIGSPNGRDVRRLVEHAKRHLEYIIDNLPQSVRQGGVLANRNGCLLPEKYREGLEIGSWG